MNTEAVKSEHVPSEITGTNVLYKRLCAIVVTYDDRHHMLVEVIRRLADMGIGIVVAVFNGNFRPFKLPRNIEVVIVKNDENLGSSGGFHAGIKAALETDADFFLLLDDDNLPEPDCVEKLFQAHASLGSDFMQALLAFRPSQPWQCFAMNRGYVTIGQKNTYGWFNMVSLSIKFWHHLQMLFFKRRTPFLKPKDLFVNIGCAPYGGLFLSRQAIQSELPDTRFFCYYDDLDFTERLAKHGVNFKLCSAAVIQDLDLSWYASKKGRVHPLFSSETSDKRIYFDLRNAFIFYRSRISSRMLYLFNGLGFWLGITYFALFRSGDFRTVQRRLSIIRNAARYGLRGEFAPFPDNL